MGEILIQMSTGVNQSLDRPSFPIYNVYTMFKNACTHRSQGKGFTLIELLIVMAVIGVLFGIGIPSYRYTVQHTKEAVLKENLYSIRNAINMFYRDKKRYPLDLEELVTLRYLLSIPQDPLAKNTLWEPVYDEPQDPDLIDFSGDPMGIIDVKSSTEGQDGNGVPYKDY